MSQVVGDIAVAILTVAERGGIIGAGCQFLWRGVQKLGTRVRERGQSGIARALAVFLSLSGA